MRPIDADKFKEDLMKLWDYSCVNGITATTVLKQVIHDLDNAPTVTPSLNLDNVTEEDIEKFKIIWQRATSKGLSAFVEERLIRCKDCKYTVLSKDGKTLICCMTMKVGTVRPDFYCGNGEMKGGEEK